MSRRTITPELREKVFELREGGALLHEIDAALCLQPQTAARLCSKEGVEHPTRRPRFLPPGRASYPRGKHVVRPFTAEEDAMIERMRVAGASYGTIGRACNPPRGHSAILRRLITLARRAALEEADA